MKRILNDYVSVAEHEVELLRRSDDHPNVVRYFAMERDHQFTYIGLEIGVATLKEIVEGQNYIFLFWNFFSQVNSQLCRLYICSRALHFNYAYVIILSTTFNISGPSISTRGTRHGTRINPDIVRTLSLRKLATELMEGLRHLHSLGLVHCDIKPQNVLLSSKYACMLSDLGLCKVLRDNQTSFSKHTDNVGTSGWMAPEVSVSILLCLRGACAFRVRDEAREKNLRRSATKCITCDCFVNAVHVLVFLCSGMFVYQLVDA